MSAVSAAKNLEWSDFLDGFLKAFPRDQVSPPARKLLDGTLVCLTSFFEYHFSLIYITDLRASNPLVVGVNVLYAIVAKCPI